MKVWPVLCHRCHNEEGSLFVLMLCCCHLQIENFSNSYHFVLVILTVLFRVRSLMETECREQRRQGTNFSSLLFGYFICIYDFWEIPYIQDSDRPTKTRSQVHASVLCL